MFVYFYFNIKIKFRFCFAEKNLEHRKSTKKYDWALNLLNQPAVFSQPLIKTQDWRQVLSYIDESARTIFHYLNSEIHNPLKYTIGVLVKTSDMTSRRVYVQFCA